MDSKQQVEQGTKCPGGPWIDGGEDEGGPIDLCQRCGRGLDQHDTTAPPTNLTGEEREFIDPHRRLAKRESK